MLKADYAAIAFTLGECQPRQFTQSVFPRFRCRAASERNAYVLKKYMRMLVGLNLGHTSLVGAQAESKVVYPCFTPDALRALTKHHENKIARCLLAFIQ